MKQWMVGTYHKYRRQASGHLIWWWQHNLQDQQYLLPQPLWKRMVEKAGAFLRAIYCQILLKRGPDEGYQRVKINAKFSHKLAWTLLFSHKSSPRNPHILTVDLGNWMFAQIAQIEPSRTQSIRLRWTWPLR